MQEQAWETCPAGGRGVDARPGGRQSRPGWSPFADRAQALSAEGGRRVCQLRLLPAVRRLALEIPFATETRFIGLAGGFRDTGKASWRAIAAAPGSKGKSVHVMAVAEKARVTVSVTP